MPRPAPDPLPSVAAPSPRRPDVVRPPAMTDVATVAGVSHQTVSRVLNDAPSVSPRTRALVLAAVEQLGYRPNTAARALATGRSRTLGVLCMSGTLYGPASMLSGVQAAAREAQYGVMVVDLPSTDAEVLHQRTSLLLKQGVDAVVVIAPVPSSAEALRAAAGGLPLVVLEGEPDGEVDGVCVDQVAVGRLATEHLVQAGHRTVWHVTGPSGPTGHYESDGREAGWRQALTDVGAEVPPPLPGDWSPRSGYDAGQLLVRMAGVTAVFAANDQMALGVLRALRERGCRVPEDVSLVGVDDIPEAAYLSPPLTTVRQDFAAVGRESMQVVLAQIESGARQRARVVLAPELVVRRSVVPPLGDHPGRSWVQASVR
ncbi:MAG: transcriptional regulator, LacI family [Frankiales bacterium]|nr:transcriptional regulator, LacI family [Frankiales bacterium]